MEGEVKPLVEATPTPEELSLNTISLPLALGDIAVADEVYMLADDVEKHYQQAGGHEPVAAIDHVMRQSNAA